MYVTQGACQYSFLIFFSFLQSDLFFYMSPISESLCVSPYPPGPLLPNEPTT